MQVYVINLARSLDRRAHITAEMEKAGLDYEIVTAVDGRTLDLEASDLIDPSLPLKSPFPAGAAGCALSHFNIYRTILERGQGEALILEDDIVVPDDLGDLVENLTHHLSGAEVVLLNFSSRPPGPLKITPETGVRLPSGRMLGLPVDVHQLVNTGAYIITSEACSRLVEGLLPISRTADSWGYFSDEGMLDRVQCVLPQPVPKCPKFESLIGLYSLGHGLKARLIGPVVRRKIPVLHQLIRYRRVRIMRHWDRVEVVDMPPIQKPSKTREDDNARVMTTPAD